mgnify:CR=1 FL=1
MLFKYIIEIANTIILAKIIIYEQNQRNLKEFATNLFCNNYKELSVNDIKYYMETYLIYSKK